MDGCIPGSRLPGKRDQGPVHWPPFRTEHVLVRIDVLEGKIFRCTVVQQPEKDWRINTGDQVLVEYYYFEKEYQLICRTVEEQFGFKWLE